MGQRLFAAACVFAAVSCGSGQSPTGAAGSVGGSGSSGGSASVAVDIQDYAFSPSSLSIKTGTTVKWGNSGATAHTVTADAGTFNSGQIMSPTGGAGGYGSVTTGGTFQFTFSNIGAITYHCSNHPGMTGTITVTR